MSEYSVFQLSSTWRAKTPNTTSARPTKPTGQFMAHLRRQFKRKSIQTAAVKQQVIARKLKLERDREDKVLRERTAIKARTSDAIADNNVSRKHEAVTVELCGKRLKAREGLIVKNTGTIRCNGKMIIAQARTLDGRVAKPKSKA